MFKVHLAKMNPVAEPVAAEPATKKRRTKKEPGEKKQKKPTKAKEKGLTSYHTKLGILGLLRVQLSFQMSLRPHMIRESF